MLFNPKGTQTSPTSRKRNNYPGNFPPPVGGLNAISSIMNMPKLDAAVMENWIPYPDRLVSRKGCVAHVTALANQPQRIWNYASSAGAETLWATTDAGIYNVTTAGAPPAAAIALTEGATSATMIATGANNYMFVVNGVDTLKQYDGAAWTSVAVFGAVATSVYSYVETYKQRIWLIRRNTLTVDYLPVNSIAGAPTSYDLGAIFRRGGKLVAMATWTIDGGNGPDDHIAFVTSTGEVAVFAGTDPASLTTWAFRGVYYIGRPLGPQCLFKYGGDLLFNCEAGLFPLSKALLAASIDKTQSVSNKIQPIFSSAAETYFSNEGWQVIAQPEIPLLIVNIPQTGMPVQYCMHLTTGAWTVFSGWNAMCFARLNGELYFADTSFRINRVTGPADMGTNITCTALSAYTTFGYPRNKMIKLIRPYFQSNGNFNYSLGYSQNFSQDFNANLIAASGSGSGSLWGSGLWGSAVWTGSQSVSKDWRMAADIYSSWKGLYLQVVSNTVEVAFLGADIRLSYGSDF